MFSRFFIERPRFAMVISLVLTLAGVKPLISIAIISYFCFRLIGFQGQIFDILKSVLLFAGALIFMLPICDVKESRFKEALEKASKGEKGAKRTTH